MMAKAGSRNREPALPNGRRVAGLMLTGQTQTRERNHARV